MGIMGYTKNQGDRRDQKHMPQVPPLMALKQTNPALYTTLGAQIMAKLQGAGL